MKILPLGSRVIIRRAPTTEKIGSIIVPDTAQKKVTRGEVIAVGPGGVTASGQRIEPRIKVGDKVVFGDYSGTAFEFDGEERIAMLEDDVLGVIDEE